jgi:hypothetical protein
MFARSKHQMTMSFLFFFLSGILLVSSSVLSSEIIIFMLLGLVTATMIIVFHFRDHLISDNDAKAARGDKTE